MVLRKNRAIPTTIFDPTKTILEAIDKNCETLYPTSARNPDLRPQPRTRGTPTPPSSPPEPALARPPPFKQRTVVLDPHHSEGRFRNLPFGIF